MLALHQNEHVLGAYRKIWVVFAATAAVALFAALAPLLLIPLLRLIPFAPAVPATIAALVAILWWWLVWVWTFLSFTNYYLDVFVVTDERIMHIEQLGLFQRRIAELRLERIQDVTIEQLGLLPTMLHYGNIRVQTAGETEQFLFSAIPDPMRVKEIIMAAQRKALLRDRQELAAM